MSFREPGWLLPVPYRYCKDQQANRANFHVLILSGHRQSLSCYNSKKSASRRLCFILNGGPERIRTAVGAFAELCLATRPQDHYLLTVLSFNQ
jgi:hypothetical protein